MSGEEVATSFILEEWSPIRHFLNGVNGGPWLLFDFFF